MKAPVDHVMADFEDACPYEFKGEKSRKVLVEALNTLDFGKKVVTVRPNNIHSKYFLGDIEAIVLGAPNRFHGIILPKTGTRKTSSTCRSYWTARARGWLGDRSRSSR